MSKVEEKTLYEVQILRIDSAHIVAIRASNYDECFELWETLHKQWKKSSDDNEPFILTAPSVTAFNPTLIKEITLVPVVEQAGSKNTNPYYKQMVDQGLGSTLGSVSAMSGSGLLDKGYK